MSAAFCPKLFHAWYKAVPHVVQPETPCRIGYLEAEALPRVRYPYQSARGVFFFGEPYFLGEKVWQERGNVVHLQ